MDRRIIFGLLVMSLVALAVADDDDHYGDDHHADHHHHDHHGDHHRYDDDYHSGYHHHHYHHHHPHHHHHHHEHVDEGDSSSSGGLGKKILGGAMSALGQSSADSSYSNGPVPGIVSDLIESTPQGALAEKVGKFALGRLG